jgi:Na+-driven multidrug efflux pump
MFGILRVAPRTLSEIKLQLKMAGPMCATYLLQVMVDMLTLIMVGHLGATELAAAGSYSID